jgi:methylmalonyl-CoA mutase N-terminal domain/subunit
MQVTDKTARTDTPAPSAEGVAPFSPEFVAASRALEREWRSKFDQLAKKFGVDGASYVQRTDSGLPVKPAYFPHDVADAAENVLAAPGVFPFTRGLNAAQYQFMPWANQPVIGYGLPEETRRRMDYLQAQGMTGYFGNTFYNLVYDLVSHEGLDPDHPAAEGRVGQCGMAVYSREDNARLFDGLPLDKMNVVHISYYENLPVLAHYLAYARRRGVPWEKLGGNSMSWYYQSAYVGMTCFPPKAGMDLAAELIAFCTKRMPRWNTLNLFGYGMEEAGATAVQEVAFTVAAGIDYARGCIAKGLEPDVFLGRFGFQISQANDFFEEVCKIRALRRIWARKCHELGARDPRSMHVRIHTHTSGVLTRSAAPQQSDPYDAARVRRGTGRGAGDGGQYVRRGTGDSHRAFGNDGTAHPADPAGGERTHARRRPAWRVLLRRGAHQPDRGGGAEDLRRGREARRLPQVPRLRAGADRGERAPLA